MMYQNNVMMGIALIMMAVIHYVYYHFDDLPIVEMELLKVQMIMVNMNSAMMAILSMGMAVIVAVHQRAVVME